MKNPFKLLEMLLTQWSWAAKQRVVCKAAFMAHYRMEDKFTADLIHAVLMHSGDWRKAAATMLQKFPASALRVQKFRAWAARLTAPKKRGLMLEWKGGAA